MSKPSYVMANSPKSMTENEKLKKLQQASAKRLIVVVEPEKEVSKFHQPLGSMSSFDTIYMCRVATGARAHVYWLKTWFCVHPLKTDSGTLNSRLGRQVAERFESECWFGDNNSCAGGLLLALHDFA